MFSFINNLFAQKDNDRGFRKANRIIKKLIRKGKIPGLAITVAKEGNTIWSKGFGYADVEHKVVVDPATTIFRIGSVSKPIAATGLAKMVEAKNIDLNASIYKYIPEFPKKKYDFTIKQLGGHMAGIRNYKGNEFMNNKPLSIKEGVSLFEKDPLLFQPGLDYAYTSYSLNLIALAMEKVGNTSFEDYIKQEVLKPLHMDHTFADKNEILENKAKFYSIIRRKKFKEVPEVNNYFKLAGGGYLSTSEDVVKLGNSYLNGSFIPETIKREFVTSQKIGENLTYYGIGWQASFDHQGRPYYGHIGNGLGGYGIFYVYPDTKTVITILMNSSNPNLEEKFNELIDAVFEETEKSTSSS